MPSTFTWLDYSEQERRKRLDVIELFGERTTRDELGLGGVRDAFADMLFPGTSTIQTRAKYFLFVPWIYQTLEGTPTGPAVVTLGGLTDYRGGVNLTASFDPIELLAVAPVVVVARVETGQPVAIFCTRSRPARSRPARTAAGAAEVEYLRGAELPAEYHHPTPALPAGTLSVLVDSDEELPRLASLVQTAKGPMVDGRRRLHPNEPGPLLPTGVYEQ